MILSNWHSLMKHQIPSDNMAWLAALHLGHYSRCKTICNMKYDAKYAEFFSLLYLLFRSSILNVLWGPGHFRSVVSQENTRSKCDPAVSKCNFAVPTVNRLWQIDFGYEKNTPRYYFQVNWNLQINSTKKFICFDGMRVPQGSKGKTDGDVDLLGAEGYPTVHNAVQILDRGLQASTDIITESKLGLLQYSDARQWKRLLMAPLSPCDVMSCHVELFTFSQQCSQHCLFIPHVPEITLELKYLKLANVLLRMSHHCEHMRKRLTGAYFLEKKLEKMRDNNPNRKDSYQWSLGHIYTISTELENYVNRAINVNLDVCKELARIQLNSNLLSDSRFVKLHKQSNYFGLLPSKYVSQHMDLEHKDNTQFCSQRSPIWYKPHQRSFVTGSSMYKGLGLDTLKAEKEHFNVYVRKLPSVPVSEEVQKYIQFSSENEINAIASLVGLIMPALLPSHSLKLDHNSFTVYIEKIWLKLVLMV